MKTQTYDEIIAAGGTPDEAVHALNLFELLRPGLKVKANGRIDTAHGDKTILGLYRMIGSQVFA